MTNIHPCNQSLGKLVESTKPIYTEYKTKAGKKIPRKFVVEAVIAKGGRLLRDERTNENKTICVVVRQKDAKQASRVLHELRC